MKPGDKVGRYELIELIGEGAMAQVFAARHPVFNRRVALKILKREVCHDGHFVARFLDDARSAHGLDHPNVVRVLDVGEADGQPFIVMELIEGLPLDRWLAGRQVQVSEALRIARDVARALAASHAAGLVHREVKPSNILIDHHTGTVKLTDFGAAKRERPGGQQLTEVGQRIGTPRYMAPEQVDGSAVDARTDLFALGATLYELLAGGPAFQGTTVSAVFHAILFGEPGPLAERRPDAPPELIELVSRLLAKAPKDRPPTAEEVAATLDAVLSRTGGAPQPSAERPSLRLPKSTAWPVPLYDRVCFTAGYERRVEPGVSYGMLVLAHTRRSQDDALAEALEALEATCTAEPAVASSRAARLPRGTVITVAPRSPGILFTPETSRLVWAGRRQRCRFRYHALDSSRGVSRLSGSITYSVRGLEVASCSIHFDVSGEMDPPRPPEKRRLAETAHAYQRVFVSYSRRDLPVVTCSMAFYRAIGCEVLMDKDIPSGAQWKSCIDRMIGAADIFQLYWSTNAACSAEVEKEWRRALALRPAREPPFIRPHYWERTCPPVPPELEDVNFARLELRDLPGLAWYTFRARLAALLRWIGRRS